MQKVKLKRTQYNVPVGSIFFVPFLDESNLGAFGYIKYNASERKNSRSLDIDLCDIYDHVCKFDEWTDDIKNADIKISDMVFNAGFCSKTRINTKPYILTDQKTDIIHPVIHGYFKTSNDHFWYDADAKNINLPSDEKLYRKVMMVFPPYNQRYVQAIFEGKNIEYGDKSIIPAEILNQECEL